MVTLDASIPNVLIIIIIIIIIIIYINIIIIVIIIIIVLFELAKVPLFTRLLTSGALSTSFTDPASS